MSTKCSSKACKKNRCCKSSEWTSDTRKYAVWLDQKSKNWKPWYWLWRTQPGRISEYCRRKLAAEEADQSIGKGKQTPKRNEWVFGGCSGFFCCQPSEIGKEQRLMYIAIRTDDVGKLDGIKIPCEATVRSVMEQINLIHRPSPTESPKPTGKPVNQTIFWNVILQQMHLWKNALQTLLKSRQKTENCMFRRFLIAMTWCQMVLPWQTICELNYAVKHWKMRICGIRRFEEPLCIPIGAASTPVLYIGQSFKNMALCRVWTVLEGDAMIMRDVKASGQGWKRNCSIIGAERQNITK